MPATPLPVNHIVPGDCIASMKSWAAPGTPRTSEGAADHAGGIDLIFADPPYNIGYKYDAYEDTRDDHDYVEWTCRWIDACAALLKPTGSLYILIGDEYAAETRVHLKKLEHDRRLVFRNWIVWHYTFGQNCKLKFNRSHAHLFYCVGPEVFEKGVSVANPPFTFNRPEIVVPSARQTTYGDARANPSGKLPDDTWYLRPQQVEKEGIERYFGPDEDTWYQSRLCGTFKERQGWHPCQLPEALLGRIIKLSSNPGDIVFDPFAGSGTTLAVAARLGRKWLGCELSEEYAKKAEERVQHAVATGEMKTTTLSEKGIQRGKPKKKAERKKSGVVARARG